MVSKTIKSIFFLLLLLFSTLKINMMAHYCHGDLAKISFVTLKDCCSKHQQEKDCCSDEEIQIDNHIDLEVNYHPNIDFQIAYLPFTTYFTENDSSICESTDFLCRSNKAPPQLSKQKLYLRLQRLLYYS